MGTHQPPDGAAPSDPGVGSAEPRAAPASARLEDQFRALLEGAPDALIIVDEAGRIQIANSQAALLFGYAVDELLGQPVELLLPGASANATPSTAPPMWPHRALAPWAMASTSSLGAATAPPSRSR